MRYLPQLSDRHPSLPRWQGTSVSCRRSQIVRWFSCATLLAVLPLLAGVSEAQQISNLKLFGKSLEAAHEAYDHFGAGGEAGELERVADIGYLLAAQSDFREFPFSFYLIDMPEPNAFALPGGHVFITKGMLGLGLDDDMLACLLGHEIAHVTKRHGTRMKKRATLLNVLSQAALIGVLIGADDSPENSRDPYGYTGSRKGSLVQGTAAAGMVLSELLLRSNSRDFEDEADVEGQRLAAAAGFDPQGAHKLWQLMNQRIPQAKTYGYWRTHPFSDSRMRGAQARAVELKIQQPKPAEDYRAQSQKVLLEYADRDNRKVDLRPFLETSALTAWPKGPGAEQLRLVALHRRTDDEMENSELDRDYGELIRAYRSELETVQRLSPQSAFVATLEGELEDLRLEMEELYPKALVVWEEGIYQTPFLEIFLSNYPTAELVPDIALTLGNAYSRIGRQADGVRQYLRAAEAGPESEAGKRALTGLRNLAPVLQELVALQELRDQIDDDELKSLASGRLSDISGSYEDLAHGSDYLRRYPDGEHVDTVRQRLEALAQNLYGEVVLYQGVGDHVKALERIQKILTLAPETSAAESLREKAVYET